MHRFGRKALTLTLLFIGWSVPAARGQCVDSSAVNGYKVRSVHLETLFGRIPTKLRETLNSHRSESYSSDRASVYLNEIRAFYAGDPAQEKYERLIANKLKLSVKAGITTLKCVEPIKTSECEAAFAGIRTCVDVTLKRYFVDVDALDSSPYLLLFPRSALTVLYGAIPRPLLALNPGFDLQEDRRFGPASGIDTATDLLDLKHIFGETPSRPQESLPAIVPKPSPSSTPVVTSESELDLNTMTTRSSSGDHEPAVLLPKKNNELMLRLQGRKSLTKSFYDTSDSLAFTHRNDLGMFQNMRLEAEFSAKSVPHGKGTYAANGGSLIFNADVRPKPGIVKLLSAAGGYRWSRRRFSTADESLPPERVTENGFYGRAIADGILSNGLVRAALWFDGGVLNKGRGSYQRAAGLFGYGKEFVIHRKRDFHQINPPELNTPCWMSLADPKKPADPGKEPAPRKNEQTVSFEMMFGAGRTWGEPPEYARYYAGGAPGQFLDDELSAQSLAAFPSGPILRSQPAQQAGLLVNKVVRGGTSFWHANVSVGIPVSRWSSPLIPHEWVTTSPKKPKPPQGVIDRRPREDKEADGHVPDGAIMCRDLKSTIKTLVGTSGVNLLVSQQARDLLTDDEKNALRLANADTLTPEQAARLAAAREKFAGLKDQVRPQVEALFDREILPITNFIADHANVIDVKPLFMFDVAHMGLQGTSGNTRYGLGSGLQVDVVVARFELGYVAALNRLPGDGRGSFVGRLILRRFF